MFRVVHLVTVAHQIILVGRVAHVSTVPQHHVVVGVAVGVGADSRHLRRVRRRYLDDGRPRAVVLHRQTEVGRHSHVHSVVTDVETGEGCVRVDASAVDLWDGHRNDCLQLVSRRPLPISMSVIPSEKVCVIERR